VVQPVPGTAPAEQRALDPGTHWCLIVLSVLFPIVGWIALCVLCASYPRTGVACGVAATCSFCLCLFIFLFV
jgi:cytochrome b561